MKCVPDNVNLYTLCSTEEYKMLIVSGYEPEALIGVNIFARPKSMKNEITILG